MGKRITIYDIAKEAGVSVATVSYVINNREDQTISEETKNKIWHVINMLNYKPNVFAKNLRSADSTKLIALCTINRGLLDKAELVSFFEELSAVMRKSFNIIFCIPPFERITNADAIVAFNVNKDTFYEIGRNNYIPLLAVNCLIEDKLFFQITTDYNKLKSKADAYFDGDYKFICLSPSDVCLKQQINDTFDNVIFVDDEESLQCVNESNALCIHSTIAEHFRTKGANVMFENVYAPICKQTTECIQKALSREQFDIHSYRV